MQDNRLRRSLPHAVVRLFRMVNREHGRALRAIGLSAEQAHILAVLWTTGPQSVGALGRALALSSPTLTGVVDRLAAQRLVVRRADPADRRSAVIAATAPPRVRRRAMASFARTDAACFAALSRRERDQLLGLVTKATDALDAAADATPPRRRRGSR